MKHVILLIALNFLLGACKKQSINCGEPCSYPNELLFNFGFENVSVIQDGNKAYITGVDTAFSNNNNWGDWQINPIGNLVINYEDGDISERKASIVSDPVNTNNNVLLFNISSPNVYNGKNPYKARIQMNFDNTSCIKEYYQKCRMYLPQPNMDYLKQYPESIYWLSVFEFWNNANWTKEKFPFRVTVGLSKESGVGKELFFTATADKDKSIGGFEVIWKESAEHFTIPFGHWMEIELYILEGDENTGKFFMAVTPDGGTKQILFDINNWTQHPNEKCPDGYTHFQPLKWYTSAELVNYMKAGGYALQIYWDDWRVYRNRTP